MKTTAELCREYIDALKEKSRMAAELKDQNKLIKTLDAQVTERLNEDGIDETTIDGHRIQKVIDESFSLIGTAEGQKWNDAEGEFFKWLHEVGEQGLIVDNVNAKTREKFLTEWKEDRKNLPDFIKSSAWEHTKVNMSKVKREVDDGS